MIFYVAWFLVLVLFGPLIYWFFKWYNDLTPDKKELLKNEYKKVGKYLCIFGAFMSLLTVLTFTAIGALSP